MREFTISETAERFKRDRSSVLRWIQSNKFPNARLVTSPLGDYWMIPESDLDNFEIPRRGPNRAKISEK